MNERARAPAGRRQAWPSSAGVVRAQWPILDRRRHLRWHWSWSPRVSGGAVRFLIGVGVGVAAARLVLSDERAGLLVVRSRARLRHHDDDQSVMIYTAWTIDPLGTS